MSQSDGGPAFPVPISGSEAKYAEGMTLRDLFAGMALQGILARSSEWETQWGDSRAKQAFEIADAMLKQREAQP